MDIKYKFYEIKSEKSKNYIDNVKQFTLVCEDYPEIFCFLWIDRQQQINHIQFVFFEKLIEWFSDKGLKISQTNRSLFDDKKTGVLKGVRTIHNSADISIFDEGMEILDKSEFPENYGAILKSKIKRNS